MDLGTARTYDPTLMQAAVEALAEGVVLVDASGHIAYANKAFADGFGAPVTDIVGRRWDDPVFRVSDVEGRPIALEDRPFSRVVRTGEPVLGYEYLLYRVDGTRVRVLLNAVPIRDETGPHGVAVTFTDITEHAEALRSVRESESMLSAFVEQSRYGLFISSISGETLLYNKAMEELTCNPLEEVLRLGWAVSAFPDEAERARFLEIARRSVEEPMPYVEYPYTRRDGSKVWLSYAVSPVYLNGRQYVAGIVSDITERKKAEQRVRFHASLLDQVRNAVVAADMEGKLTYLNAQAESLFGISAGEAIGRDVRGLIVPRSPDRMLPGPVDAEGGSGHWEGEWTVRSPDGAVVPVLLSIGLLRDGDGRPEGFVSVISDIREIKAAQRALEEKDRAIRQAYVDVVGAVTGGKLVLMTDDELSDALGDPVRDAEPLRYETLGAARHAVRDVMRQERTLADPDEGIVAFGEAATNALKHAGGGRYCIHHRKDALQVVVADAGPGIDFAVLPHATLTAGFSTKQTLGIGFTIMLDLADRVLLATATGSTRVVLEFGTAAPAPATPA